MDVKLPVRAFLGSPDMFVRLIAIGIGLNWIVNDTYSYLDASPYIVPPWMIGLLVMGVADIYLVLRSIRIAGWLTLIFVLCVGISALVLRPPWVSSDVLSATREALTVLFSGSNPYLHTFITTVPPGSPFPYLPGELLFYGIPSMLFHSIDGVDKMAGIGTCFLIAALAPIVGTSRASLCLALYGTSNLAGLNSVNGGNDGSLAFLLIASMVLLAWHATSEARSLPKPLSIVCLYASAVVLAWALLFKALSWVFFPFIVVYLLKRDAGVARRYIMTTGGLFVLAVLPFLILSPNGFLLNIYRGFTLHTNIWGLDVWAALLNSGVPMYSYSRVISFIAFLAVAYVFLALLKRPSSSLGGVFMRGLAVLTTALFLVRWSSPDYYAFAFAVFVAAVLVLDVREREYGNHSP